MDYQELKKELEQKRSILVEQLEAIDTVLSGMKKLNGLFTPAQKAPILRRDAVSERLSLEVPDMRDFAISEIRRRGKEISCKELFNLYYKKIGKLPTASKERTRLYANFSTILHQKKAKKMGITCKVFKLDGVGREVYINVDSAMLLQTAKALQNPNIPLVDVK